MSITCLERRLCFWLCLAAVVALQSCAPSFTRPVLLESHPDLRISPNAPKATIGKFTLQTNASSDAIDAMKSSVATAIFNSGRYASVSKSSLDSSADVLRFNISIIPQFQQHFTWPWYLGIFTGLTVIWPVMPRYGEISLTLNATVTQGHNTLQTLSLEEQDTFDFFLYGPYRQWTIQDQTDFLYKKLLGRLTSTLRDETVSNTDDDVSGVEQAPSTITKPVVNSARKPSVTLMDPECNGIDSLSGQSLNSKLNTQLFALGIFQFVERQHIQDILKEQGLQNSGVCSDAKCYVHMGQLAGLDDIFIASYSKLGSVYLLSLRAISVSTGNILDEVTTEIHGGPDQLLSVGIPDLVSKLHVERFR